MFFLNIFQSILQKKPLETALKGRGNGKIQNLLFLWQFSFFIFHLSFITGENSWKAIFVAFTI